MEYMKPTEGISFSRTQFPVWPAFAMTVNKSQGQTLTKVGLIFDSPPFAHGQCYVAFSRVRSDDDIRIYATQRVDLGRNKAGDPINITKNVVYHEIL